jgi:hypothetical protein
MATAYYWVIWLPSNTASVSGPGAKPATPSGGKVFGPYNTAAEAQQGVTLAEQHKGASLSLGNVIGQLPGIGLPSWSLIASGFTGYFVRGLKILFGGILIVLGISHATGLDNAVTRLAGKAALV